MNMIILSIAIFSANTLIPIEYMLRPRILKYTYEANGASETIRLNYDEKGNINSAATFSTDGALSEIEFYFYERGCARKIVRVQSGKVVGRTLLIKNNECLTEKRIEQNASGQLISYRLNEYKNGVIVSYVEYDATDKITSQGTYFYKDGKLMTVEFQNKKNKHTLQYAYDPAMTTFIITHTIVGEDNVAVRRNFRGTFDRGPATKESLRNLFE